MKLMKQFFCLILSTTLLFPNTNLFAQNMSLPSTRQIIKSEIWPILIDKLQPALIETQASFDKLLTAVQKGDVSNYQRLISEYQTNLKNASHIYSRYKGKYNAYNDFLKAEEIYPEIRLARQYGKTGEELPEIFILEEDVLFGKLNGEIEWLKGLSNEDIARRIIGIDSDLPYLQEILLNRFHYEDMIDYHKIDMKAYTLDLNSANYIRKHLKPEDVLEYAYNSLNSKAKAAVDLNLKLHYSPEKIHSFITGIRKYYKEFRHIKAPGYIKLMKTVRSMSFAERENYLLNVVAPDLTEGNRKLIKDIETLQNTTKTPFVKKLMSGGPMIIIGSILIACTITSIAEGNNFTADSMSPKKFVEIQESIEKDYTNLKIDDILAFYESDMAEKPITENLEHAIIFTNIVLSAQKMEEIAAKQTEQEYTNQYIIDSLPQGDEPDYDKNYGVGSLSAETN